MGGGKGWRERAWVEKEERSDVIIFQLKFKNIKNQKNGWNLIAY